MNLNDILSPQTRARVYLALGIVGLVLGAAGAGIGAFAASGFTAPLIVGATLSAVNAVYSFVAGAFGFVAKANTPTADTNLVRIETEGATHLLNPEYDHYITVPVNLEDNPLPEDEDDSGPVG